MNSVKRWTKVVCRSENADEMSLWAFECTSHLGTRGSQSLDDDTFVLFLEQPGVSADLIAKLSELNVTILSEAPIEEENWVKNCSELWQPVVVKNLTLTPVLDEKELPRVVNPGELFILPGNGFGTGHHQSTQLALSLLQDESIKKNPPKLTLDLGTGNGILALATALLYNSKVIAIDNDPLAIDNAKQNLDLNPNLISLIELQIGVLGNNTTCYDLVLANIYAHTLVSLAEAFFKSLAANGYLILSGIMEGQKEDIYTSFVPDKWELITEQILPATELNPGESWVAFLYRKISRT